MSLVLGPIHYWMYAKIRLAKARERAIFLAFYERYGREAEEASGKSLAEYDGWLRDDRPMEARVGDSPIHAWLQGQIDQVERSEAELVASFLRRFEEEAQEISQEAARGHGRAAAEKALAENDSGGRSARGLFELLRGQLLDGMPCDHATRVAEMGPDRVVNLHHTCLHFRNWDAVQVPLEAMCRILHAWIEGFCQAYHSGIEYRQTKTLAQGDPLCEEIFQGKA
ncbi:MAG: L-2-amino-thiazoline-4-carboxylic acid hydrolase [Candidatus Tectomicrobia bacterium]|uniref:L-2-amino-thiazoline-4-carboxylic acid hydrolase n=1 Tax=Tectimicrobiota bacterium TaxID=2528274 RepID=A0A932FXJ8_UNCTE|nr:L-2-amino-thiazoline-4-carboxylic acid hydrolase [Candidatus Tectomicrobia bacterium]